jgi:16S rRNA (guanine527-N7)-methyltransferase
VVDTLFPTGQEKIHRYVDMLMNAGVERGLIGPREAPRLWERHIINCAVVRDVLAPGSSLADIGSGAGLPGVVLAISRPDLRVTLIEPLLRRATFLLEVVAELGLEGVAVARSRAEDLPAGSAFDAVTARAVAPLSRLVPWGLPLCRSGGELVALKGASVQSELDDARDVLLSYHAGAVRIEHLGVGMAPSPTTVVRIQSNGYVPPKRKGGQ